jgi:hypothetical protein
MALKPTLEAVWIDMITIQGLTVRQQQLCELMWSCRDLAQVRALIRALPTLEDRQSAETLMLLIVHETLEDEGGLDDYAEHAAGVVDSIRSR